MVRYLEQDTREKHFSSRERQLEKKPASGAPAGKGKNKVEGESHSEDCVWNETRYREEAGTQKKGFATIQLSTTEFFCWKGRPWQK